MAGRGREGDDDRVVIAAPAVGASLSRSGSRLHDGDDLRRVGGVGRAAGRADERHNSDHKMLGDALQ